MNRYKIEVALIVSATNTEAAEDITREILGSDEAIQDFEVLSINDDQQL